MIIDVHTHVFPPDVAAYRQRYLDADSTFAELYASPTAKLAAAPDLLRSMDAAGIDASVALGFAWTDAETCRRHNDYLLEAATASGGRLVAFCTLPLAAGAGAFEAEARRCVAAGAPGFGELRPDSLAFDLAGADGQLLADLALELDVALLFHVSEPVGHTYPGKQGLRLAAFYDFVLAHPGIRIIGAHWAGGLPFYALMPEVKQALASLSFDTAGTSLLYDAGIYQRVAELAGVETVLFGSDFPLLSQQSSRARVEQAGLTPRQRELVLGENARRLLRLE